MTRWAGFFLAILVGTALGLAYGWLISPVEYVDPTPDSLRIDFKADYVLMVAEAYRAEKDLGLAARRLAILGTVPPAQIAEQALRFAEQLGYNDAQQQGYSDADLDLMRGLVSDLQSWIPIPTSGSGGALP